MKPRFGGVLGGSGGVWGGLGGVSRGDLGELPKTPKPSGERFGGQNEPSTGRGVPSSEESAAHPDVMIGVAVIIVSSKNNTTLDKYNISKHAYLVSKSLQVSRFGGSI
mgnify:CR=1 FL=1